MTKEQAKEIQKKYGMEIMMEPVTSEAHGLYLDTPELIPELDTLTEDMSNPHIQTTMERIADTYRYKIVLPTSWFDLWGWK